MTRRLAPLLALGAALCAAGAAAQTASVFGVVLDAETEAPVVGATVVLADADGTRQGRAAGTEGEFAFTGLPPGPYVLAVSAVGYAPSADTLALGFGDRLNLAVELAPEAQEIGGVSVEAAPPEAAREPGLARLTPADLALPTTDPGGDLAAALLFQAGVTTVGDRGGQISVRGGTPTQNLVLVDGIPVFQPFHLLSSYSLLPAGVVRTADVYAGGFPARYGGRIASVVDVTGRTANKRRLDGAATVSPFLAGLELEVPVVPGDASVLASVRESLLRDAGEALGVDLPYRFGDAYLKGHARLDRTSSLQATVLRSYDEGTLGGRSAPDPDDPEAAPRDLLTQRTEAAGAQFFSISSAFAAAIDVSAYWSRYQSTFEPAQTPGRSSEARVFGGRFGYVYYIGPHVVRTGIQTSTYTFAFTFDDRRSPERVATSEGTVFVDADVALTEAVRLEPGLRVQAFPSQSRPMSIEPRLLASWARGGHVVRAAAGLHRQEIVGLTDQRDLGDVFTAWTATVEGAPVPRALHLLGGWEGPAAAGVRLGAEGYAKALSGQTILVGGRLLSTNGEAAGLDLTADVRRGGLHLDLRYGLSTVVYRDAERSYRPPYHRPHRVALAARYGRGPWVVRATFQLTSGRPASRVFGSYRDLSGVGRLDDLETAPGVPTVLFEAEPYAARTPPYHRLDLSVERALDLGPARATLHAAVVNAYDRANVFYYDPFRDERVDQLPLLPSLGLRVEIE